MSDESWLPIPGFEGLYEVSDIGRVRSCDRIVVHGKSPQPFKSRIMKAVTEPGGYQRIGLSDHTHKRFTLPVHRLVLLAFVGEPPVGTECCHNNGDASDNRLENLRWDTRSENGLDKVRSGNYTPVTHCRRGHPYDEENTYVDKRNGRTCRTCVKANQKRRRASHVKSE